MANNKDITTMSDEDLKADIEASQNRLKKMKFSHAITPIENPMDIRTTRKHIARLITEQHKRKQINS